MPIHENPSVTIPQGHDHVELRGQTIRSFVLTNASSPGMSVQVMDLGATVTHLWVPNGIDGAKTDVILGFDDLTVYRSDLDPYFGASVGRIANRVGLGSFTLPQSSTIYNVPVNNGPNSLHGGTDGFSFRVWQVDLESSSPEATSIVFKLTSEHLDQGYPGKLHVSATFTLANSALTVAYKAFLDSATPGHPQTLVSLTNHAYFNLSGVNRKVSSTAQGTGDCLDHLVAMRRLDHYLLLDDNSLPTGAVIPLKDEPAMDFTTAPKTIGRDIAQTQASARGYDHYYVDSKKVAEHSKVWNGAEGSLPSEAPVQLATITSPVSKIRLNMMSTDPGFQLYTANWVDVPPNTVDLTESGKARAGFGKHAGFCLEASRFPDAIHHADWQDQVLVSAGHVYESTAVYAFSTTA